MSLEKNNTYKVVNIYVMLGEINIRKQGHSNAKANSLLTY